MYGRYRRHFFHYCKLHNSWPLPLSWSGKKLTLNSYSSAAAINLVKKFEMKFGIFVFCVIFKYCAVLSVTFLKHPSFVDPWACVINQNNLGRGSNWSYFTWRHQIIKEDHLHRFQSIKCNSLVARALIKVVKVNLTTSCLLALVMNNGR